MSDRLLVSLIPGMARPLRVVAEGLGSDQFYEFCRANEDLRIERTVNGTIEIMPPTGARTGNRNLKLAQKFANWSDEDGSGEIFDSSTGCELPNGATRSPDVSWVSHKRLKKLDEEDLEEFLPLCPDFALELLSATDSLTKTGEKMQEYLDNGCRLGWLIDPKKKTAHIYRPDQEVEIIKQATVLDGEDVLPGFRLELEKIWDALKF